ncbi:hypothetical protein [Shewanella japonica]|uniref:hypothetical protein n=1 Tax=Shewanella japonica TaxID=93973 RepID=UPI002493D45F|nr:hypothetical protein [Shewanella japonica]
MNESNHYVSLKHELSLYFTKQQTSYVLSLILSWKGSAESARNWFECERLPEFGRQTAKQLCNLDQADEVIKYFKHLESGGYA